jgi:predicted nucleic acid-binding protein
VSDAPVVSNSSPLIALGRIGRLELLHTVLGDRIVIPPAVAHEVFRDTAPPSWIRVAHLTGALEAAASPTLGLGEREAIALALEIDAALIILDDLPARRLAASRGLSVIGTAGLLLAAKRAGAIPAVLPLLDALVAAGFHLSDRVRDAVLTAAGEE